MVSTLPQQLLSYLPLSSTAPEKIYPMNQDTNVMTTAIITTSGISTSPPSLIHRINVSKNASADIKTEPVCEVSTIMASSTFDGRQYQAAADSLSITYVRGLNREKAEDSAQDIVDSSRSTALLRTEGAHIRVVRAHVEGPCSSQLSGSTTSDIVNRSLFPSHEQQRRKSIYDQLDVMPAPVPLPDLEAPIEESREWALDRMQQLNEENEAMEMDHDAMDVDEEIPQTAHKATGTIRGTPISLAQLGNRTKALDALNGDYPESPISPRHPIDPIAEICDVSSPNGSPSISPRTSVTDLSQTLNFKRKFSKLRLPLKRSLSINNFRDKSDNSVMNIFMKKRMRAECGGENNGDDCASEYGGEARSVLDRIKSGRRVSSCSVLDAQNKRHFPRRNGLSRSSTITNDSGRPASHAGSSEFGGSEYGDAPITPNAGATGVQRSWSHIDVRNLRAMFKKAATDVYRSNSYSPSSTRTMTRKELKTIALWKNTVNALMEEGPSLTEAWMNGNEPTPRSQQIRRFVVQEMYTTEQTYLDHLQIIRKMFMNPFIEAANSHNPLVNPADISVIFAHVSDLIELSTIITRKLEFVSQNWREDESLVGQIFGEHEDDFDVYIRFAINFKASQKAIKRANNNILYRRFIQDALRNKETNRLGLSDYMIIPIQRITRYCLLLRDLKKNTPPTHVDHDDIDAALKSLMGLALAMNDVQKFH